MEEQFSVEVFNLETQKWTPLIKFDELATAKLWIADHAANYPGRQIQICASYKTSIEYELYQYTRNVGLLKMSRRNGWQPANSQKEATNG